jgi:hypothetical protein
VVKSFVSVRKNAVDEGRAFIRVRMTRTGALATAGVCPACWNLPSRRSALLSTLSHLGYAPARREDLVDGVYRAESTHAPGCPYGRARPKAGPKPWKKKGGLYEPGSA